MLEIGGLGGSRRRSPEVAGGPPEVRDSNIDGRCGGGGSGERGLEDTCGVPRWSGGLKD